MGLSVDGVLFINFFIDWIEIGNLKESLRSTDLNINFWYNLPKTQQNIIFDYVI